VQIEASEEKFLKGSVGRQIHENKAVLLKQASDNRSFTHAANEL